MVFVSKIMGAEHKHSDELLMWSDVAISVSGLQLLNIPKQQQGKPHFCQNVGVIHTSRCQNNEPLFHGLD